MTADVLPTVDDPARVIVGDSLAVLRTLPAGCVHCVCTSPPYWSLRDYGVEGQIGLEATPAAFVTRLVEVFREVRRVLHPSGVLWVNMGDSYNAHPNQRKATDAAGPKQRTNEGAVGIGSRSFAGLKPKDLCGVPWMLAFALRDDGWWLRSDIIWAKPSPMPESVTDRCTKAHEYVFMLTKRADYFFDAEAIKEAATAAEHVRRYAGRYPGDNPDRNDSGGAQLGGADGTRNKRTVWTVASDPYPEAHFATFPPALVEPMVKAGSSERGVCPACFAPWVRVVERSKLRRHRPNDLTKRNGADGTGNHCPNTVAGVSVQTLGWEAGCKCDAGDPVPALILDPFAGSGTTLAVAVKLKRRALGIELNPAYAALCEKRLAEPLGTGGLYDTGTPVVRTLFDPEGGA